MLRSSALLVLVLGLSHRAIATVSFVGDPGYGASLVPWPRNDKDNHEGNWHDDGDRDDDDHHDHDRGGDDREQDAMELPPGCTKDRARDLGCEHIKCICERSADGFLQELATSVLQTCKTMTDFGAELDRLPSACDDLDIKIPDSVIEHASSILNSFTSYPAASSRTTPEQSSTRMTSIAEEPKTSPTTADAGPGKTTKTTVGETPPETSQPTGSATIPETSSDTGSTTKSLEPTGSRQQPSTTDTIVPGTASVTSPTVSASTGAEPPEGPAVTNGGSPFDSPVSGSRAEQPGRSLASLVLGLAAVAVFGW